MNIKIRHSYAYSLIKDYVLHISTYEKNGSGEAGKFLEKNTFPCQLSCSASASLPQHFTFLGDTVNY